VTCLDAGAAGEMVRVRFLTSSRILRAQVMADGTLRAGL
jgi:flagella basal body P-ring formation protein FlgA